MISRLTAILRFYPLTFIGVNCVSLGIIHNASLDILAANITTINGTCAQCVCRLLADPAFFSFNCYHQSITCQLHSAQNLNLPFALITNLDTSFYFRSLPTFVTTPSTVTCIHELSTATTGEGTSPRRLLATKDLM